MKHNSFGKIIRDNKKLVSFLIMVLVCSAAIFAQSSDTSSSDTFGLNSKVKILVELLSSPWVKGIACIALIVECIGLITAGRQEPGMFKKFIPWIAGTIIFMAAGTITKKFLDVNSSTFSSVMSRADIVQPEEPDTSPLVPSAVFEV